MALRNDSYTLHLLLPTKVDPLVSLMKVEKVPDSTYDMIGGLDQQIKEIKEVSRGCRNWRPRIAVAGFDGFCCWVAFVEQWVLVVYWGQMREVAWLAWELVQLLDSAIRAGTSRQVKGV